MIEFRSDQIAGYEGFLKWLDLNIKKLTEAYWLHGSRAVNIQHAQSDLDVIFIVRNIKYKKKLEGKLKNLLDYKKFYDYFNNNHFEYWKYKNKEVGIKIYTYQEYNKKTYTFFDSTDSVIGNQDFIEHVIINSFTLHDPKNILAESKKYVSNYPLRVRKAVVIWSLNRIKQEVDWWNTRKIWLNVFQEMRVIEPLVSEISRCHYALNGRYYMYSKKHYNKDLMFFLPDIRPELDIVTRCQSVKINNKGKRRALTLILRKLNHQFIKEFGL